MRNLNAILAELLAVDDLPRNWRRRALCSLETASLFFTEDSGHGNYAKARALCESCPVRECCLLDALSRKELFGFAGGKSAAQRIRMLEKLAA